MCLTFWCCRTTSFSGVFQRSQVAIEKYRILESVKVGGLHTGRLACLFEVRFFLRVLSAGVWSSQVTGSLLSLLSRVPSEVHPSTALRLASDFVCDRTVMLPREDKSSLVPYLARSGNFKVWIL